MIDTKEGNASLRETVDVVVSNLCWLAEQMQEGRKAQILHVSERREPFRSRRGQVKDIHVRDPEVYMPPDSWPSWRDFEYPLTPEDLEGLLAEGGLETWALHTVMQHNAVQRREATNLIRWNTALAALAGAVLGLLLG